MAYNTRMSDGGPECGALRIRCVMKGGRRGREPAVPSPRASPTRTGPSDAERADPMTGERPTAHA